MENDAKRKSIEDEEVDDDVVSDEKNSSAPQLEDSGIDDDVFYDSDGNEQDEEWVLFCKYFESFRIIILPKGQYSQIQICVRNISYDGWSIEIP